MGFRNALKTMLMSNPMTRLASAVSNYMASVRLAVLKKSLKACGSNVAIQMPVHVSQPEYVEIGEDVSIAAYVHIWGGCGVRVGARTMIGSHAAISAVTHDYRSEEMWRTVVSKPVAIEADVWIGSHAVIFPGITVGAGAVIGAGSVVTDDVPARTIVAGVPARRIGTRPSVG